MDRARDEQAGPRGRHPDRGGDSDGPQSRPHRDAGDVVRAVPEGRDGRDHDARPPARAADDAQRSQGPVTPGYGTLGAVTDVDPSPPDPADTTTSASAAAFTADDLVRWTG